MIIFVTLSPAQRFKVVLSDTTRKPLLIERHHVKTPTRAEHWTNEWTSFARHPKPITGLRKRCVDLALAYLDGKLPPEAQVLASPVSRNDV